MRGKPWDGELRAWVTRSIPACAGETRGRHYLWRLGQVYPRVCGGNAANLHRTAACSGLSPRVRGKPRPPARLSRRPRSIPACAGETGAAGGSKAGGGVYPRVCGGNAAGLTPAAGLGGLSPRVRGKRRWAGCQPRCRRSIPACAGETCTVALSRPRRWVYPRVCGGNPITPRRRHCRPGLSPRVRGKLLIQADIERPQRSIPACAGETPVAVADRRVAEVYPRVCGGNRSSRRGVRSIGGLSPRVRGKLIGAAAVAAGGRSIPACAGETLAGLVNLRQFEVYPRVCGGNTPGFAAERAMMGLSPRVRGKPS